MPRWLAPIYIITMIIQINIIITIIIITIITIRILNNMLGHRSRVEYVP